METETAFQQLKAILCTGPVLATPDFTKQFVLQTDASEVGIGAVLSQVQDNIEHPLMYVSRKLLKHERNYATIEKEGLAIRWALGKLQHYLLGREFMLVTDHAPLKWMATHKSNNARITRWFLELQNFRFRVEHRPGTQNGNADALSRRHEVMWTIAHINPRLGAEEEGIFLWGIKASFFETVPLPLPVIIASTPPRFGVSQYLYPVFTVSRREFVKGLLCVFLLPSKVSVSVHVVDPSYLCHCLS